MKSERFLFGANDTEGNTFIFRLQIVCFLELPTE